MIKRNTSRFKLIDEANALIPCIERATTRLTLIKQFIGSTPCVVCRKDAPIETFCYGCLEFICDECQPPDEPKFIVSGKHDIGAHKESKSQRISLYERAK